MTFPTYIDVRGHVQDAINASVTSFWPFPANRRDAYRTRIVDAVMGAIGPVMVKTIDEEVQRRIDAHTPINAAQYELEFSAGYRQGHQAALIEAATKLKRHGHRSAVTRLLELADEPTQTPARPQPAQSPADGPGHPPVDTTTEPPEPLPGSTDTPAGPSDAQRGPVGPETATPSQPVTRAQVRDITREYLRDVQRQARRG